MCGRIIQSSGPLRYAVVDGLDVRDSRVHNYPPRWNAAPSQELWVIRRNHATGELSLDPLRWGLIPSLDGTLHEPEHDRIGTNRPWVMKPKRFVGKCAALPLVEFAEDNGIAGGRLQGAGGVKFLEPIPQQIWALRQRPIYPQVGGAARVVNSSDVDLFGRWLTAFLKEAAPHDPLPTPKAVENTAAAGDYRFWIVDGEPVAMAGIVRRTRRGAAIAGVYTPPALRNRGYAAAVTAATVDRVFAEGKTLACLYSDLRNSASNRCYAKIGFEPVCRSVAAFVPAA
jgi:RimJ/RimL family protein N-acetyltransferase